MGEGELTMGEATLAGFDPVWPVLAVSVTILIAIVIGLVRFDRLASRQPVQADSPAVPTEFGSKLSATTPAKTSPATRRGPPPR